MAIATTGPLALKLTIRAEELVKSPSLPETDVSTREISESAGFDQPDAFSEFYGYSSAILPTMASIRKSGGPNDNYFAAAATPATSGFVALTSRGFYMGTDSRGPQYNTRYQVDTSNSLGEFSKGFGGLSGGTTYYVWGYVQNIIGEAYTSRLAVATLPAIPLSDATNQWIQIEGTMRQFLYQSGKNPTMDNSYWSEFAWDNYWYGYMDTYHVHGLQYLHPYYGWVNAGNINISATYQRYGYDGQNGTYGNTAERGDAYTRLKRANGAATRHRRYGDYRLDLHIGSSCCQNVGWSGEFLNDYITYISGNSPYEKDISHPDYCYSCSLSGQIYGNAPDRYYSTSIVRYQTQSLQSQYTSLRLRTVYNSYWYY